MAITIQHNRKKIFKFKLEFKRLNDEHFSSIKKEFTGFTDFQQELAHITNNPGSYELYTVSFPKKYQAWYDEVYQSDDGFWCDCDEPLDPFYVPDGYSEVCHKHHWCCNKCHKIVQVG